jgi:hypothetical protein
MRNMDRIIEPRELEPVAFREAGQGKRQAKLGGKYNLLRNFSDDGELFDFGGRTYALSNQWSLKTISVVDQVIHQLPPGSLSYSKTNEAT